eukprot:763240-Hanusia_phi.AAC.1
MAALVTAQTCWVMMPHTTKLARPSLSTSRCSIVSLTNFPTAKPCRSVNSRWKAVHTPVPILDLAEFAEGNQEAKTSFALRLRDACESSGMFYLTGHGITSEEMESAFTSSRNFFELPTEAKQTFPCKKTGGFTRGYFSVGEESGSPTLFEAKEAFSYGYEWDPTAEPENPLQGPNIWPNLPGFGDEWKHPLQNIFKRKVKISECITDALAIALDLSQGSFSELCRGGDTISLMRMFHYLPFSSASATMKNNSLLQSVVGSSPHTDWGWLTIILQDPTVTSLQIFDAKSKACRGRKGNAPGLIRSNACQVQISTAPAFNATIPSMDKKQAGEHYLLKKQNVDDRAAGDDESGYRIIAGHHLIADNLVS